MGLDRGGSPNRAHGGEPNGAEALTLRAVAIWECERDRLASAGEHSIGRDGAGRGAVWWVPRDAPHRTPSAQPSTLTWCFFSGSSSLRSFSTTGTTNASVLPEPVHASTATSLFPANSGMVASCTGVARLKPWAARTRRVSSLSPGNSANLVPDIPRFRARGGDHWPRCGGSKYTTHTSSVEEECSGCRRPFGKV